MAGNACNGALIVMEIGETDLRNRFCKEIFGEMWNFCMQVIGTELHSTRWRLVKQVIKGIESDSAIKELLEKLRKAINCYVQALWAGCHDNAMKPYEDEIGVAVIGVVEHFPDAYPTDTI